MKSRRSCVPNLLLTFDVLGIPSRRGTSPAPSATMAEQARMHLLVWLRCNPLVQAQVGLMEPATRGSADWPSSEWWDRDRDRAKHKAQQPIQLH